MADRRLDVVYVAAKRQDAGVSFLEADKYADGHVGGKSGNSTFDSRDSCNGCSHEEEPYWAADLAGEGLVWEI